MAPSTSQPSSPLPTSIFASPRALFDQTWAPAPRIMPTPLPLAQTPRPSPCPERLKKSPSGVPPAAQSQLRGGESRERGGEERSAASRQAEGEMQMFFILLSFKC